MKKKILVFALAFMFLAVLATPLVQAVPGAPKKNPKFQTFHYTKEVQFIPDIIVLGDHEYVPSFEEVNRLVITTPAGFVSYAITIGSTTYTQGIDFECIETYSKMYYNKPVFANPAKLYPAASNASGLVVDTTFDFDFYPGGIEGTLQIREVGNEGASFTNSLRGTGMLKNVQLKAVYAITGFDENTGILTVVSDGTVIGWPE